MGSVDTNIPQFIEEKVRVTVYRVRKCLLLRVRFNALAVPPAKLAADKGRGIRKILLLHSVFQGEKAQVEKAFTLGTATRTRVFVVGECI